MTITEQEDALFQRWKKRRPDAVPDGLVDEREYRTSSPRIIFVMKEVNNPTDPHFDLRRFLQRSTRRQTWDNVARWLVGIRNPERDIPWRELMNISDSQRATMLRLVGIMNVKKTPGGHTAKDGLLRDHARDDADLLAEQFTLYTPDLVVCCGSVVADVFSAVIGASDPKQWQTTSRGIRYWPLETKGYVVAYSHPEARFQDSLIYYGLVDAVKELRSGK